MFGAGGGGGMVGFDPETAVGGTAVFTGTSVTAGRKRRGRNVGPLLFGPGRGTVPAWFLFRGIGLKLTEVEVFPMLGIDRMEAFVWRKLNST